LPKIISITPIGTGSASTWNGLTAWTQPVKLEVSKNGGSPVLYHVEIELIDQGGVWAFLTTSTPTPGP
jgi:hypothetical protein